RMTALLPPEIVEASEKLTPPASMSEIDIDAMDAAVPGFPAVDDVPDAATEPIFRAPPASEMPAARDVALAPSTPLVGCASESDEMKPAVTPASGWPATGSPTGPLRTCRSADGPAPQREMA